MFLIFSRKLNILSLETGNRHTNSKNKELNWDLNQQTHAVKEADFTTILPQPRFKEQHV